jgi:hypothetical protein
MTGSFCEVAGECGMGNRMAQSEIWRWMTKLNFALRPHFQSGLLKINVWRLTPEKGTSCIAELYRTPFHCHWWPPILEATVCCLTTHGRQSRFSAHAPNLTTNKFVDARDAIKDLVDAHVMPYKVVIRPCDAETLRLSSGWLSVPAGRRLDDHIWKMRGSKKG